MKYLVRALIEKKNPALAEEVEQVANLPNHRLSEYDEPFGMKPWPKSLYAMKVNDSKVDSMVEEHLEDEEAFEEKYGVPEGWGIPQTLDILILLGEFSPLTPKKTGNTSLNLARALMQLFEAWDDAEMYMGKESGFPQSLRGFESAARWLVKQHLVSLNSTRLIEKVAPEGCFHLASVNSLLKDYKIKLKK